MNEELQLFLEDMDEQLSIMESTLLDISEISLDDVDKEMIDKLFRAMHTMKGNAGIFNYEKIVEFAHAAENLLDEIRNGKINLTRDMVDTFLLINDHSKVLIDIYTKDNEMDEEQLEHHDYLLGLISDFLEKSPNEQDENIETSFETEDNGENKNYKIEISLKDEFFKSGMDIISIIKYLDAIGEVGEVKLIDDFIPPIDEIDPLNSYIKLVIMYETDEPKNEIIEAFEFVQEDIELKVSLMENESQEKGSKEETQNNDVEKTEKTFRVFKKAKKGIKKEVLPKDTLSSSFTLKVDSLKVDKLINQISEMVIANAKISRHTHNSNNTELEEAVAVMSEMLEEVRNGIMNIRMVQVGDSLAKLRRIVTDSAKKLNKEISFQIIGGETELDKTVIEKISDPLVHMLRNSVDHGIETPLERDQKGKKPKGNITLKAYPDAGTIVIQIIDDGAGIDKDMIFNKAVEKNLVKANAKLSENEIFNLILAPGFSTANEVTDISGRGVGMDVVKRNIQDLRGTVDIDSKFGLGTTITVRLPLTLAIIDGFLVQSGESKYIIPIDHIQECIELTKELKEQMRKNGYISLRSNILPILDIAEHFEHGEEAGSRQNVVIVKYGKSRVGLKVDELHGEFQTVIKPLGELFENISGISGGTILGNGEIALIFDIQKLIEYKITQKESENGN